MWFNPRWPAPMTHFTRNWHKHFQFTVLDIQIEVMAHPCSQDLLGHWSFCSGSSSHSSKRSAKGLTDHLRFFAHRVLFVRKGSDAIDPFLWSGLSADRMTAEGQHAKHTVLSSGSGMSRITMAATAYGWCHPQAWHLCRRGFWVHSCLSSSEMLSQMSTSMKSFELLCFMSLSSICLKVFLFVYQRRSKEEAQKCEVCISIATCRLPVVITNCVPFKANGSFSHHKQIKQEHCGFQICYNKATVLRLYQKLLNVPDFKTKNAWLTANSPAVPFGASSPSASCLSNWASKLLSIQAWCSMVCCTIHSLGQTTFHRHVRTQNSISTTHEFRSPRFGLKGGSTCLLLPRALLYGNSLIKELMSGNAWTAKKEAQ